MIYKAHCFEVQRFDPSVREPIRPNVLTSRYRIGGTSGVLYGCGNSRVFLNIQYCAIVDIGVFASLSIFLQGRKALM